MKKNNILITGGFGILGRALTRTLLRDKNKYSSIFILDKLENKKRSESLKKNNRLKIIKGNLKNYNEIYNLIKKENINIIFHLGAITQVIDAYKSPMETFKSNIFGTINILESIRNLKKEIILIFSSSDKAYGTLNKKEYFENHQLKGDYPYDVSKSSSDLIAQSYTKTYNLKIGIIRSGNIYGPGDYNRDRLIPHVIISTLKNKKAILRSNGKLIRDYIFVDDVARAYHLLMNKMLKSEQRLRIYNVGSKENLNVIDLVKLITNMINKKKLKPIIENTSTNIEIKRQKLNFSKIKKDLGWRPKYNIKKAIKITINWYKKNLSYF